MHDLIAQLRELNETVPVPLELPTFEQLVEIEEQILLPLPAALREYLLFASDVTHGALTPVTASDPASHTYLPEVTAYAWSVGLPRTYIAICQDGEDFYAIDQQGEVILWRDDAVEHWDSFWQWAEDVWLQA